MLQSMGSQLDTTELGSERASPLCPVTEPGRRAWAGLPLKDPKSMRPALLSASHFYTCPAKVVATRQLGTLRLRAAARHRIAQELRWSWGADSKKTRSLTPTAESGCTTSPCVTETTQSDGNCWPQLEAPASQSRGHPPQVWKLFWTGSPPKASFPPRPWQSLGAETMSKKEAQGLTMLKTLRKCPLPSSPLLALQTPLSKGPGSSQNETRMQRPH